MKKLTKVVTKTALKFGQEQARTQWFDKATPGVVLTIEAPFLWVSWRGETKGVPISEVLSVEAEDVPAAKAAKAS